MSEQTKQPFVFLRLAAVTLLVVFWGPILLLPGLGNNVTLSSYLTYLLFVCAGTGAFPVTFMWGFAVMTGSRQSQLVAFFYPFFAAFMSVVVAMIAWKVFDPPGDLSLDNVLKNWRVWGILAACVVAQLLLVRHFLSDIRDDDVSANLPLQGGPDASSRPLR